MEKKERLVSKHVGNTWRKELQIVKLTLLLMLFTGFDVFAIRAFAQNEKVTIREVETSVRDVLKEIENQSPYTFFFNERLLNVDRRVSVNLDGATIQQVLDQVFAGRGVSYRFEGENVILSNQFDANQEQSQRKTISGTVKDRKGVPIPGVTVMVKGTTIGAITDSDGKYSLTIQDESKALVFSFIGMETQTIVITGKKEVNITMQESAIGLDEVVAVGYGVVKKSSVTGSIASVKAEDLSKTANASVSGMLSGKAAGMQVSQSSAQPGGGVNIVIRGAGSDKAGNQPLYVIDGFPVNNSNVDPSEGDYSVGSRNPLNSINPNDIESIEILKDAASTAIYGARAANGVILITTKRGKEGRTNVDFSYTNSVQQIDRYYDMLDAKGFMEYSNILGKEMYLISSNQYPFGPLQQDLSGYKPAYTQREIAEAGSGTDWWDEVTRIGKVNDANLSISGGNSKTNFLFSVNYFNQEGLVVNSDFLRFSSRLNLDHKITDKLKVGVSSTASYIDNGNVQLGESQWQASGVLVAALQMSPLIPIFDETGDYSINPNDATLPNPVSYREIDDNTIQKRLLANSYVEYEPIKGLQLRTSVGVDTKSGLRNSYLPTSFLYGASVNGKATKALQNNMDLLFNMTANYNFTFHENHNISALIGYEYQEFLYDGFSAVASNFYTDAFGNNNMGAAEGIPTVKSNRSESMLASYFTRLNYNFKEKYIASFTLRRDGSSNFGEGNKWGFFPSLAVAWRLKEENFLSSTDYLSNLKLRLSYGQTGNSGIGDRALAYYGPTNFPFMFGDAIAVPSNIIQLPNSELKWETTTEFNVGLDYGFFRDRISGSVEYYNKVVSDLLAFRTLPIYSEIRSVADNIGKTQLSGIELDLHTVNIDREFKWKTDLNFATYQDKWKERNPDVVLDPWQGVNDPIRSKYGYITEGVVQVGQDVAHMENELPGNLIYKDLNGFDNNHQLTGTPDGKINDADKVFLGSTDPGFSFGIGNTFEYKGFDLNIFFYGMGDRVLLNANKNKFLLDAQRLPTGDVNMMTDVSTLFLSSNPSTTTPGIATNPYQGNSDYLLEDASFIRLKNITLGYSIPRHIFNNQLGVRVYFDAQNLWLATKYSGIDPEFDSLGAYPNAKTFSFGLNVNF